MPMELVGCGHEDGRAGETGGRRIKMRVGSEAFRNDNNNTDLSQKKQKNRDPRTIGNR